MAEDDGRAANRRDGGRRIACQRCRFGAWESEKKKKRNHLVGGLGGGRHREGKTKKPCSKGSFIISADREWKEEPLGRNTS